MRGSCEGGGASAFLLPVMGVVAVGRRWQCPVVQPCTLGICLPTAWGLALHLVPWQALVSAAALHRCMDCCLPAR